MGQTGVQTPWIPLGLYYIWYMEVCSTRIESTSQDNSKVIGLDKSEHQTLKSSSQYVVSEIKHSTCCLRNQAFHMLSQKSSIQFVVSEIKHSICCLRNQAFNLLSQKSSIQFVVSEIKHSICCLRNQAFNLLSQKSSIQFVVSEIKHSICCLRNQAFNLLSQKSSIQFVVSEIKHSICCLRNQAFICCLKFSQRAEENVFYQIADYIDYNLEYTITGMV